MRKLLPHPAVFFFFFSASVFLKKNLDNSDLAWVICDFFNFNVEVEDGHLKKKKMY